MSPPSRGADSPNRIGALRRAYGGLDAPDLLVAMITREFPGEIAVVSSFGAESAVLLDLVAQVDRATPVIFLDTGALFDETLEYRDQLTRQLGLSDLRVVRPAADDLPRAENLWSTDPDACCRLRKVLPLRSAAAGFAALVDGRKQAHGGGRAGLATIEPGGEGQVKISPLANWPAERIARAFAERGLPRHPLFGEGYRSIGCWPCTRPVAADEPVRAGRWAGAAKTECGIHRL